MKVHIKRKSCGQHLTVLPFVFQYYFLKNAKAIAHQAFVPAAQQKKLSTKNGGSFWHSYPSGGDDDKGMCVKTGNTFLQYPLSTILPLVGLVLCALNVLCGILNHT